MIKIEEIDWNGVSVIYNNDRGTSYSGKELKRCAKQMPRIEQACKQIAVDNDLWKMERMSVKAWKKNGTITIELSVK